MSPATNDSDGQMTMMNRTTCHVIQVVMMHVVITGHMNSGEKPPLPFPLLVPVINRTPLPLFFFHARIRGYGEVATKMGMSTDVPHLH